MRHQLQQTVFNVEPIKNVVGVGGTAAYQIEISAVRRSGWLEW